MSKSVKILTVHDRAEQSLNNLWLAWCALSELYVPMYLYLYLYVYVYVYIFNLHSAISNLYPYHYLHLYPCLYLCLHYNISIYLSIYLSIYPYLCLSPGLFRHGGAQWLAGLNLAKGGKRR